MDFKEYLDYFGWSQAVFAGKIGVTPETVSRWQGNPPQLVMMYLHERWSNLEFLKETAVRLQRFVS